MRANVLWVAIGAAAALRGGQLRQRCVHALEADRNARAGAPIWPISTPKIGIVTPALREEGYLEPFLWGVASALAERQEFTLTVVTTEKESSDRRDSASSIPAAARALFDQGPSAAIKCAPRLLSGPAWAKLHAMMQNYEGDDAIDWAIKLLSVWPTTYEIASATALEINKHLNREFIRVVHHATQHYLETVANSFALQVKSGVESALSDGIAAEYISFYHPDCGVTEHDFAAIASKIASDPSIRVLQQCATYMRNWGNYPDSLTGELGRAAGIQQSVLSLGTEFHDIERSQGKTGVRRPYTVITGYGLTVNADFFISHGGFTPDLWGEDMALSWLYHVQGVEVRTVPLIASNELAATWAGRLAQQAMWARTALDLRSCVHYACQLPGSDSSALVGLIARRALRTSSWIASGPAQTGILTAAALNLRRCPVGATTAIAGLIAWMVLPNDALWRALDAESGHRGRRRIRRAVASVAYQLIFSWIAPAVALKRNIFGWDMPKPKTER